MKLKYYVKINENELGDSFDSYQFVVFVHIIFMVKTFASINHMSYKSTANVLYCVFWVSYSFNINVILFFLDQNIKIVQNQHNASKSTEHYKNEEVLPPGEVFV